MKKVYKYPFPITDEFVLELPAHSRVLSVGSQPFDPYKAGDTVAGERACLWVLVDPEETSLTERHFVLRGTGHKIPDWPNLDYVGTFQQAGGALVWHLFERK